MSHWAKTAYESALKSTPGRLRAEYGRRCFRPGGGTADRHYRRLLTNCSHADSDLPELTQANYFFGKDKIRFDSVPTKLGTQTWNVTLHALDTFSSPVG
jgi:hypothetical protein